MSKMNEMKHSIEINAPKEKVWEVLWSDQTFRDWSGFIDEGTYMEGKLEEGNEINFIGNSDGGVRYGVTSRVEKLVPNQHILFTRIADIVVKDDGGIEKRDDQWTGGTERYDLEENNGKVTLSITQDVPDELVEYFNDKLPQALARIKVLSEPQA